MGEKTLKNAPFVEEVSKRNILNTIEVIKKQSPILQEMMDKGNLKIIGGYYSLKTGEVNFL